MLFSSSFPDHLSFERPNRQKRLYVSEKHTRTNLISLTCTLRFCCSAASAHRLPLGLSPGSGTRSSGLSYKSPVRTSRCSTRGRGTPAESTSRRADTSTSIAVRCVGRIGLKTLAFSGSRARGDFSPRRLNHHHPKTTTTPGLPRRRTRTIRPFVAGGGRTFETEREKGLNSIWKKEDDNRAESSLFLWSEKSLSKIENGSPQKCFSFVFFKTLNNRRFDTLKFRDDFFVLFFLFKRERCTKDDISAKRESCTRRRLERRRKRTTETARCCSFRIGGSIFEVFFFSF